uniref:Uncharacterized protein n=1 Tax=Medicago truncatula TaxID=3880 RepID=I3SC84_MEDTR|nr:unknown [Medicago truncatula]
MHLKRHSSWLTLTLKEHCSSMTVSAIYRQLIVWASIQLRLVHPCAVQEWIMH